MVINKHNWFALAKHYLQATAGELLSGTIHNINNHLHVLDMQVELLNNKMDSIQAGETQGLEKRLTRLSQASKGISDLIQETGKRQFYLQTESSQVDISEFLHWQYNFWGNNLFFKHHINLELDIASESPSSLQMPPCLLTFCIEQALKNALEACTADNAETLELRIAVQPYHSGLSITLFSPTELPQNEESSSLDPWEPGSSSKPGHLGLGLPLINHCAQAAGWECELSCFAPKQTQFILSIPNLKTEPDF
jgi:hypothetical protein